MDKNIRDLIVMCSHSMFDDIFDTIYRGITSNMYSDLNSNHDLPKHTKSERDQLTDYLKSKYLELSLALSEFKFKNRLRLNNNENLVIEILEELNRMETIADYDLREELHNIRAINKDDSNE